MHFGFRESGQAWLNSTADVVAYTNYWLAAMQRTGAIKREDWPRFMAELFSRGIATDLAQQLDPLHPSETA